MPKSLPRDPSLYFLQKEAKAILKAHKAGDASACETLRHHAKFSSQSNREILGSALGLQDVQHALALEYGFASWLDLRRRVEPSQNRRLFEQRLSEAQHLLEAFRHGDAEATQRVRKAFNSDTDAGAHIQTPFDAQQVVAREQGKASWEALYFETANQSASFLSPDHPFIVAVRQGHLAQVRQLLEANPQLANARIRGDNRLSGMVWEPGADQSTAASADDPRNISPLHFAAVNGLADLAHLLIEFGAEVDSLGYDNNHSITPPIVLAAWEGDLATLQVLLEAGADPNLGDHALFTALEHGRRDKAAVLLRHGATHDIFTAAMYGDLAKVEALLDERPDRVHLRSSWRNRRPIEEAVNLGQLAVAEVLIKRGSAVPPQASAALGRLEDIQRLLNEDLAAVHAQYGSQPLLCWAAHAGQSEMVDYLIERGADPNQEDEWGVTALRKAATAPVVDCLVKGGAELNRDTRGATPFAAHMSNGTLAAAAALLRHGADPNQKCSYLGRTAYHGVLEKNVDLENRLRFLVGHGADPSIPDDNGQTPLDLALQRAANDTVVGILRTALERP